MSKPVVQNVQQAFLWRKLARGDAVVFMMEFSSQRCVCVCDIQSQRIGSQRRSSCMMLILKEQRR